MLTVSLALSTVHGTERGGEDLFVEVLVEADFEPDPASLAAVFPRAWEDCVEALPKSQPDADSSEEEIWSEGGRLSSYETEYGFKLDWTLEEVRAKVEKVVLEGDWVKRLKTGKYEVREDLYVDGNAD
jgi:hypothetical protein